MNRHLEQVFSWLFKSRLIIWIVFLLALLPLLSMAQSASHNLFLLSYMSAYNDNSLTQLAERIDTSATNRPNDSVLNRIAGMILFRFGDFKGAQEHLLWANRIDPSNRVSIYWLGQAYERIGDYGNAMQTMYRWGDEEYFPVGFSELTDQRKLSLSDGLLSSQISAYAHDRVAEEVYVLEPDLARKHFELAIQKKPSEVRFLLEPAWFYYGQGDFIVAEEFGKRATTLIPTSPWPYLFLGTLNRGTGNIEQAINNYVLAIQLSDKESAKTSAYLALADVYSEQNNYNKALELLTAVQQEGNDLFTIHLRKAALFAKSDQCIASRNEVRLAQQLIVSESDAVVFDTYFSQVNDSCP